MVNQFVYNKLKIITKSLFFTYSLVKAQQDNNTDGVSDYGDHNPYVYSEFDLGDYPDET